MVPEAELVGTERGLVPKGEGWFVLNARETQWWERPGRGVVCEFEGAGFEKATDFHQLGINLTLLGPGEPMAMIAAAVASTASARLVDNGGLCTARIVGGQIVAHCGG